MKAHLSLGDNGNLIALLESGDRILVANACKMADQLQLAGVTADSLTVADWKTDPDHAPLSGQIIAVKAALRHIQRPEQFAESVVVLFEEHHETLSKLADSDTGREP